MIPRYQRILFYSLSGLILLIAVITIYQHQRAHNRVTAANDAMPYIAPVDAQTESITLDLANDADGSILSALRDADLPQEPSQRARSLLERLFTEYALPESQHPIKPGTAVDDVFLLKPSNPTSSGLLAVVNLHGAFADTHPSGVTVESLTLQSIIGTLHANLPQVTEIRFLVDGQPRETLAGHADLLRTYPAIDTASQLLQPSQPIEIPQP
ncbi:GerMN domain-containing protein [Granulicella arctica]|uniref:GerMN domain-containing protein n=1 Tax=Granulicella arctica TaxID=940613 RepID=A0A7Y9PL70_9BACT|nr:GerMN domain-containing protein [Granulicella arctica]NYF81141.1 hypothetical protein [Granulicella arctica]